MPVLAQSSLPRTWAHLLAYTLLRTVMDFATAEHPLHKQAFEIVLRQLSGSHLPAAIQGFSEKLMAVSGSISRRNFSAQSLT